MLIKWWQQLEEIQIGVYTSLFVVALIAVMVWYGGAPREMLRLIFGR